MERTKNRPSLPQEVSVTEILAHGKRGHSNVHVQVLSSDARKGKKRVYIPRKSDKEAYVGHYYDVWDLEDFDLPAPTLVFHSIERMGGALRVLWQLGYRVLVVPLPKQHDVMAYGLYCEQPQQEESEIQTVQAGVQAAIEST